MWNQKASFRFEIDNFSEKEGAIESKTFVSGGCEWYLTVCPKGHSRCDDHLPLSLCVPNSESLRTGWKRSVTFYFLLLTQSDKELYRSLVGKVDTFCAESPRWGFRETLPLSKFQEKGFLEKDRLIIEVYMNVVEAVDGEDEDVSSEKETVDSNAFRVFASQVTSVRKIFAEHVQKTEYKNVLSNACSKLSELAEVGSKMDWLKSKIDEVSLKRKKADGFDVSQIQQLEERIKNLELKESLERKESDANVSWIQQLEECVKNLELKESGFKLESRDKMNCLNSKLEDISLKRQKSYVANRFRFQKLEERVKNLELMELHSKLDCLESKLEEDSSKTKKSDDAHGSQVQQHEERIKNLDMELHLKLDCLESKLEQDSLERKKSDDAHESQVQQHEERIKNLELMISDLKVELDKEKAKYFDDEYLLVD